MCVVLWTFLGLSSGLFVIIPLVQFLGSTSQFLERDIVRLDLLLVEFIHKQYRRIACLFPLRNIKFESDFEHAGHFFFKSDTNFIALQQRGFGRRSLIAQKFPPIEWDGPSLKLSANDSYAGFQCGDIGFPHDIVEVIAGALLFAIPLQHARAFCMAPGYGGLATLDDHGKLRFRGIAPVIPSLAEPVLISNNEVSFLKKTLEISRLDIRVRNALQFAYTGWHARGKVGFIANAIALDSLYGVKGKVGLSLKKGIARDASHLENVGLRAELLYAIRNKILHGQLSDILLCPEYSRYYDAFDCCPLEDQFNVLRECVWARTLLRKDSV